MADGTLLSQPAASSLTGLEYTYGVQGGVDVKMTTAAIAALATVTVPPAFIFGGRLTVDATSPVPLSDVTSAASIFYSPGGADQSAGPYVPNFNGTIWAPVNFLSGPTDALGLTLSLVSNHLTTTAYDIFAAYNGGVFELGTGPAWANSGAGTSSRGTGAGTTQLALHNGTWVNAAAITLRNGGATWSVPQYQATFLGSAYMVSAGHTALVFNPNAAAGGSNPTMGLSNAYNRRPINVRSQDSTSTWTYGSTTARDANASANNRINWFSCFNDVWEGEYSCSFAPTTSVAQALTVGMGLDVDVTTNAGFTNAAGAGLLVEQSASNNSSIGSAVHARLKSLGIGRHFIQAGEETGAGSSCTMFGNDFMQLQWRGRQ